MVQLQRFAEAFGVPLVRWRGALAGASKYDVASADVDDMYDSETELWQYFVAGGPVLMTSCAQVQPTKGLVNGSQALMHSLTFADGQEPPGYTETGYRVITLAEPPAAVNVRVGDHAGLRIADKVVACCNDSGKQHEGTIASNNNDGTYTVKVNEDCVLTVPEGNITAAKHRWLS